MTRRPRRAPARRRGVLSIALGACTPTPAAAPALTDPEGDRRPRASTSLADVKTFEFTGDVHGQRPGAPARRVRPLDDQAGRRRRHPEQEGQVQPRRADRCSARRSTRSLVGNSGLLQGRGAARERPSTPRPTSTRRSPVPDRLRRSGRRGDRHRPKLVAELQAALAKLPSPLDQGRRREVRRPGLLPRRDGRDRGPPEGARPDARRLDGDVTFDLWTRKSDYRPAKIGVSIASARASARSGITLEIRYDVHGLGRRPRRPTRSPRNAPLRPEAPTRPGSRPGPRDSRAPR